jgi:hypothetical protein
VQRGESREGYKGLPGRGNMAGVQVDALGRGRTIQAKRNKGPNAVKGNETGTHGEKKSITTQLGAW